MIKALQSVELERTYFTIGRISYDKLSKSFIKEKISKQTHESQE